jgi:hypothetical protein
LCKTIDAFVQEENSIEMTYPNGNLLLVVLVVIQMPVILDYARFLSRAALRRQPSAIREASVYVIVA